QHDVADQLSRRRHRDAQCIFDRPHAGQCVYRGTDAADTLRDGPRIARVAADENLFEAPHHGSRAEGVGDHAVFHYGLNAQMALDASYWIDNDACHSSYGSF